MKKLSYVRSLKYLQLTILNIIYLFYHTFICFLLQIPGCLRVCAGTSAIPVVLPGVLSELSVAGAGRLSSWLSNSANLPRGSLL